MISEATYSLLALQAYETNLKDEFSDKTNRPRLPLNFNREDWQVDNLLGFSYGIYRNPVTGEVVVGFAGTNGAVDWLENLGLSDAQLKTAARVSAKAIKDFGFENISFTGHSLGGGIASTMAVWFDRPAVVGLNTKGCSDDYER